MMMAELIQRQASVVHTGIMKDDIAETIRRVRQMAAAMADHNMTNAIPVIDSSSYATGNLKRNGENGNLKRKVENGFGNLSYPRIVTTETYKVPDKMVGFIIGKGGEQIIKIQQDSGCKIQIAQDGNGTMDRPCTLTGSTENIEKAKKLLNEIVEQCRFGPGFYNDINGNSRTEQMCIPTSKVGLVIGRGGETIKLLQEQTGIQIVLIQNNPMPTGESKTLKLTGDPRKVQKAREMVLRIIRDRDQGEFKVPRTESGLRPGVTHLEVSVPKCAVGAVIGRNGDMIRKIQLESGVKVQFKYDEGANNDRLAQVVGNIENCHHAIHMINQLVQTSQEKEGCIYEGIGRLSRFEFPPGMLEMTYAVPADKCGLVIGKGGETIKHIKEQSQSYIELQRNPPPTTDPNLRLFTIRGTSQNLDKARQMINEKIGGMGMVLNSTFPAANFNQPPPAAPVLPPPSYLPTGWATGYQVWAPQNQPDAGHNGSQASQMERDVYLKKLGQSCVQVAAVHAIPTVHTVPAVPGVSTVSSTPVVPTNSNMNYNGWMDYYQHPVAYYSQGAQQPSAMGRPEN